MPQVESVPNIILPFAEAKIITSSARSANIVSSSRASSPSSRLTPASLSSSSSRRRPSSSNNNTSIFDFETSCFVSHKELLDEVTRKFFHDPSKIQQTQRYGKIISINNNRDQGRNFSPSSSSTLFTSFRNSVEKTWILFCESLREDFVRNLKKIFSSEQQQQQSHHRFESDNNTNRLAISVFLKDLGELKISLTRNPANKIRFLRNNNNNGIEVSGSFSPTEHFLNASSVPEIISISSSTSANQDSHGMIQKIKEHHHHQDDGTESHKFLPIADKNSVFLHLRNPRDLSSVSMRQRSRSRSTSPVVHRNENSTNGMNNSPSSFHAVECTSSFDFRKFSTIVETIFSLVKQNNNHVNDSALSSSSPTKSKDEEEHNCEKNPATSSTFSLRNNNTNKFIQIVKMCFLMAAQKSSSSTSADFTLDLSPIGSLSIMKGCRRCWFRISKEFSEELTSIVDERERKSLEKNFREEVDLLLHHSVSIPRRSNNIRGNNSNDNAAHIVNQKVFQERLDQWPSSCPKNKNCNIVPPIQEKNKLQVRREKINSFCHEDDEKIPLLTRVAMMRSKMSNFHQGSGSAASSCSSVSSSSVGIRSSSRPSLVVVTNNNNNIRKHSTTRK